MGPICANFLLKFIDFYLLPIKLEWHLMSFVKFWESHSLMLQIAPLYFTVILTILLLLRAIIIWIIVIFIFFALLSISIMPSWLLYSFLNRLGILSLLASIILFFILLFFYYIFLFFFFYLCLNLIGFMFLTHFFIF